MNGDEDDQETRSLADVNESGGRLPQEDGMGAAQDGMGAAQDGMPPAVEPVDSQDPEGDSGPAKGPRPRWLVPVIAAVVVVVVVVAGLIAWRVASNRSHERALEQCSRQVRTLQASERQVTGPSSDFRRAVAVKTDQVKDAKTVKDMAKAVGKAKHTQAQAFRCEASMPTDDLQATTGKAKKMDDVYRSLDKAAKAVLASRDAKSLDDAKKALNAKKDEAAKLLGDSDGKVADNATRDALQQAISQAGQVKGGKAKAYQDAAAALQSAIDQVNASIQQKSQADQAAQQQAAQQAAQAQAVQQPARRAAPSYGGGRGGYTPSYQPSYNRGSGSGGGAAGGAAGGGASTQTTPQGGGSSAHNRLPPLDTTHHGCNPDGSCGIG